MTSTDYFSDQANRAIEKRIKTRLRIGDFFPVSTTLFNGEPATEIFFQGCPWQCRNCQHPALISPLTETTFDWQDILHYLMCRRGLIDHVIFNGAEPLSQTHVIEAIMQCKTMGFMVGLHTCGIFPLRLESVLPLIDWLWFEVLDLPEHYPDNNLSPDSGHTAWRSLQLAVESGVPVVCELHGARDTGARQHLQRIADRLTSVGVQHLVLTIDSEEATSLLNCCSDIQLLAQKFAHFSLRNEN